MNHHSRGEVGIEELPQLTSGGVDDAPTALIDVGILVEDPETEISNLKVEDEMRHSQPCQELERGQCCISRAIH